MQRLGLTWVLVAGRPRRVSDFAGTPPARRPAASCPACGRRLILKLGPVRRHHAAHPPDATCVATRPETALHLDVKLALAARLADGADPAALLTLRLHCAAGADACGASRDVQWVRGWDEVIVEGWVAAPAAQRRPDILLRRAGVPIAAIEVLVSHRVTDEKAEALARLGVPWVELCASEALLEALVPRDAGGLMLPADRIGPDEAPAGWRCDAHARRETLLRAARVVDSYRAGGARERRIYRVEELRVEHTVRALSLRRDGREVVAVAYDGTPASRRVAWSALRVAFEADLEALRTGESTFHDSPMRWATGEAAENIVEEGLFDVRPGDPLPLATRYPRRWYFAREEGRWFLPPDMREVRWDRASPDAFAAHPAWARSRSVVAERPVPVDSWRGVVFARRPLAASFGAAERIAHHGTIAVVSLEAPGGEAGERALVVVGAPARNDEVRRMERMLDDEGVEHLWLSHPLDWSAARADLAWAAAAGDARGRPVVLVDGLGIYRAEAFARAFARGDRRLAPEAIRARMAERVMALRPR